MSDPIGTYTFLPWLRQGIANRISAGATGDAGARDRRRRSTIEGTDRSAAARRAAPVQRTVELYGPGDIVGIDAAPISRTEPRDWVTNFEPNYLPRSSSTTRTSPGATRPPRRDGRTAAAVARAGRAGGERVRRGRQHRRQAAARTSTSTAASTTSSRRRDELWAWAHVHVNGALVRRRRRRDRRRRRRRRGGQRARRRPGHAVLAHALPAQARAEHRATTPFSCPPSRAAGWPASGIDPSAVRRRRQRADRDVVGVGRLRRRDRPEPTSFPYYYRWYFRTGDAGDFEYLVRLLKPQSGRQPGRPPRHGRADPAPNIAGHRQPDSDGVLRLGGALRRRSATLSTQEKDEFEKFDDWATPYPQPFQRSWPAFVNLADSYQAAAAGDANADPASTTSVSDDPDPLITPPLYGRWHALTERLLTDRDGTDRRRTDELGARPEPRSALARRRPGFGTDVVQDEPGRATWRPPGSRSATCSRPTAASGRRRSPSTPGVTGTRATSAALARSRRDDVLLLTAPMHGARGRDGLTVRHRVQQSPLSAR